MFCHLLLIMTGTTPTKGTNLSKKNKTLCGFTHAGNYYILATVNGNKVP